MVSALRTGRIPPSTLSIHFAGKTNAVASVDVMLSRPCLDRGRGTQNPTLSMEPQAHEKPLIEKLLSAKEVAEVLGVSEMTVKRLVDSGELPCYRFVRRQRFRAEDVRTWLQAQPTTAYRGPTTQEQMELEMTEALHASCRCEHVVQLLVALLAKSGARISLPSTPASAAAPETLGSEELTPVQPAAPPPDLLTTKEAAAYLRVSELTIYRMLKNRRLPSVRNTRRHLIRRADLEELIRTA